MTVVIAVSLHDRVLLMADGRNIYPLAPNKPPNDKVNKIHRIGNNIAVLSVGIGQATSYALCKIDQNTINNSKSANEIVSHIRECTGQGWIYLIQHIDQKAISALLPTMRVGFLFGGYTPKSENFIGGILFHPNGPHVEILETKSIRYIVLGGEAQKSKQLFKSFASSRLSKIQSTGKRIFNNQLKAHLKAGVDTIREVAKSNHQVGTNVRYAVIRKGYPYYEKWYS